MKDGEREGYLLDELTNTQWEIVEKVEALKNAEWDSPTLKIQISEILEYHWKVNDEVNILCEKGKKNE